MDIISLLDNYGLIGDNTEIANNYIRVSCPFHSEGIASFSMRLDNGIYHCFGCGEKGNVKNFVMRMENCHELKAMIILKKYENTTFVKQRPVISNSEQLYLSKMEYDAIPDTKWKLEKDNYMIKKRKFKPSILKFFGVKNNDCNKYFPITIPILDNGNIKGILKRRIDNDDRRKYMNNKGFSRKKVLGGMYEEGWILVVEGYIDMMMAYQLGYKNVACLLHWRASDSQIQKLKHFTNKIISGLDNTPLGEEGTKILSKYFKTKRFKYSDDLKDMGDFKGSKYKFRKCIYDTIGG